MTRFNDLSTKQKASKKDRFDVLAAEIDANVAGDSSIAGRVESLETAVGAATGDHAGGIAKDVADLKTAVGDAETDDTLVHDVADLYAYIAEIFTANESLTDPRANAGDA